MITVSLVIAPFAVKLAVFTFARDKAIGLAGSFNGSGGAIKPSIVSGSETTIWLSICRRCSRAWAVISCFVRRSEFWHFNRARLAVRFGVGCICGSVLNSMVLFGSLWPGVSTLGLWKTSLL